MSRNAGSGPYDVRGRVFKPCSACRKPITFVKTGKGQWLPVTTDGMSHYLTCDDPKRFSKK